MISEVMNSVLMFATFVLSDVEVEQCVYSTMDMSCSALLQCSSLCSVLDCSTLTCSGVDDYLQQNYKADHDECFHITGNPFDTKITCVNDNGGSDNGGNDNGGNDNGGSDNGGSDNGGDDNGGSDNGGSDNGGSDNGGSDNSGSDNSGSDNGDDDDVTITISTCYSQNGLCDQQCTELELDLSSFGDFSTCEKYKTHISKTYVGFEDYGSCFTPTVGGVSGADTIFACSGGAAGSSSSDNTGMIVGIVIGCIVLVAGIATFVFCMKKKTKL